jgi:glycosyltransferase involved in cell wall biosynthesis
VSQTPRKVLPFGLQKVDLTADNGIMRVVLAHEWFITPAGSDKVAARIASALNVDEVITAINNPQVSAELLDDLRVTSLVTNRLPGVGQHRMKYAPLILAAWASKRIGPADVLVSSTHFGAMGAGRRFNGPHVAYCHSPLRYAWRNDLESDRVSGAAGVLARRLVPLLQRFDRRSADTVSLFVANSTSIAERIRETYQRQAAVVHPCVDVVRFSSLARARMTAQPDGFLLCFGRMVSYKKVDLAVRLCTERSLPLIVAGAGPCVADLKKMAGPTVRFEENVSDARYLELLQGASALLFPGEEDFGIIPVEAMAAGVPVVAFAAGGALDTVVDGVTGVLFNEQTVESLGDALDRLSAQSFDPDKLHDHSRQFRPEEFDRRLREVVWGHLASGQRDSW